MSTASRIQVLPDLLVKKIAAGEVVERPASVVKELLENAIDAGAGRIAMAIEDGGKQLIRVTDDGCGMSPDELRMSVIPHATSKIRIEDDLYSIATLGFRGEALASISSVAKLRIVSRVSDSPEGHEIRVSGDQLECAQAAGKAVGTTVEVRDLFFNVPARRKFLRTNSTETGHINEQFARAALAHPRIHFELTNRGRVTQMLPSCEKRLERIGKFYGPELASDLMKIEQSERGVGLEIYAAPPGQSRATAQWQYTFVNGRYVRDRFIQHALKEAYRGLFEPNRHAVVFLFITIDPGEVDVNVHPTKIEVRWAQPNLIHSQILASLRETFQRCDLTPRLRPGGNQEAISAEQQERIRQDMASALKATTPIAGTPGTIPAVSNSQHADGRYGYGANLPGAASSDPTSTWRSLYAPPTPDPGGSTPSAPAAKDLGLSDSRGGGGRPRAVQMHNLYLVAETDEGIVIVDQHALHERVLYEQLTERMTAGPLESQRLLLPETLNVTPRQAALIETNAKLLGQLGIDVSPFGEGAVAIHAFPALLKDIDVLAFMRDLLDHLAQQAGATAPEEVINDLLSMMACKAAVKAGDPLSQQEIDTLFERQELLDRPSSCPHGRPTTLRLTKAELNRQFKRT